MVVGDGPYRVVDTGDAVYQQGTFTYWKYVGGLFWRRNEAVKEAQRLNVEYWNGVNP